MGADVDIPFIAPALGISPPFVFETLPFPDGVPTNFATGDFLLFTGLDFASGIPAVGNDGPLTITFDQPVSGVGAQFAVDDTFDFDATITAFDSSGERLASFTVPGTASTDLDDSAVFLGVRSETANIVRLDFSSSIPERAFAINTLSLVVPVPEPGTAVALASVALVATALKRRC